MWNKSNLRVLVVLAGVCAASVLAKAVFHATYHTSAQSGHVRVSLPEDWSHRHVVFSSPPNVSSLLAIRQDPRLLHQWLKHNARQPGNLRAGSVPSTVPETDATELSEA